MSSTDASTLSPPHLPGSVDSNDRAGASSTLPAPAPGPLAALAEPVGYLGPDEILSRFLAHVSSTGISLYPAQEEALLELMSGKHVVLSTPTGSGKSLVATGMFFKAIAEGKTAFYTCPIKALVNEKFFDFCDLFGAERVGLMTGDATINREAPLICCTAEILANLTLRDRATRVDYVVMDEFHYYADRERGVAWQIPLLCLTEVTYLLMSATLGDTRLIERAVEKRTGREFATVRGSERPIPLDYEYRETPLHETIAELVRGSRAPVYLVNFTQRSAAEEAQNLTSVELCTKEEKEAIKQALYDVPFTTPFGKELQKFLRHGVGLHHAGLLPRYRLLVEKLAQSGLLKVVSGTDTLGVGVNIPLRTVLFTQLCKFDGVKTTLLSVRDFQQIAGRAGRKGFDTRGYVMAQAPAHVIENKKLAAKGGKKFVPRKPPQKGYVPWDPSTFDRLIKGTPEPLESRFSVSFGMLINLLSSHASVRGGGYRRLVELIARSHESDRRKTEHRRTAAVYFRTLNRAGIIHVVTTESLRGRVVEIDADLQRDFSLNQTLSLYLVDTLPGLDRQSPEYALDVLTLVESILENPDVVLRKQLDRVKDERMAQMKADGVEYEQRIAELDTLEWPKPCRDFIYETFNAFSAKHPWVGGENVRPKSVAREIYETLATFSEYVRELGLERSEGVLLRYLADAHRTLEQTVPPVFRNDEVDDIVLHLRAILRETDSSLLEEWENLRQPGGVRALRAAELSDARTKLRPLRDDPKALIGRVRIEMHRLVKLLATRQYDAAVAALHDPERAWTATVLASQLQEYWSTHASIITTPESRRPHLTSIRSEPDGSIRVVQRLLDPSGDDDWAVEGRVDLAHHPSGDRAGLDDLPIVELMRVGV
jgi:superfamily II RNA helicase